jgi:general secretion pathway protein G
MITQQIPTPMMRPRISRTRRLRAEAGYTLLEIMMVLSIIALLLGAVIYTMSDKIDIAKELRVKSDLQAISTELRTYEMLNYRKPTTEQGLKALVQMPSSAPKPQHWKKLMESVPLDPWGNEYVYRNPGKFKTDGYDLYSLGPKGEEGEGNIGK